jgi:hypothetical protein
MIMRSQPPYFNPSQLTIIGFAKDRTPIQIVQPYLNSKELFSRR